MDEMTHELCSENLRAYVSGDLPPALASEVRAHLEGCAECGAEEAAVRALLGPEPGLDDLERARLHRELTRELFNAPANAEVAGSGGGGWKRWVAPALGSAAAVLVAALVLTGGPSLVGGGDDMGDSAGGGVEVESSLEDAAQGSGADDGRTRATDETATDELTIESNASGSGGAQYSLPGPGGGPEPEFVANAGEITTEELAELGRESDLFRSFANRYGTADADSLRGVFTRRLARSSGKVSEQVRRCAESLPDDEPLLPAYGANARYEGRNALVLGFVTNDAGSRSLDRYLMWVWAKGSCRQPIDTLFERIDH